MNPSILKFVLILVGLIYVISPVDFIPDLLGFLGRLDDIIFLGLLFWYFSKSVRRFNEQVNFYREKLRASAQSTVAEPAQRRHLSPHEVLEISPSATKEEIVAAYKRLMFLYHPDKVAHLGKDLNDLAHEKSLAIQKAYEDLRGEAH